MVEEKNKSILSGAWYIISLILNTIVGHPMNWGMVFWLWIVLHICQEYKQDFVTVANLNFYWLVGLLILLKSAQTHFNKQALKKQI